MKQKTTWSDNHVPLHDLNGIVSDKRITSFQNILETEYLSQEWGIPAKQVLLSGDGHWWITLDYRNGDIPSIAWIDVECDEDIKVAESFAEFLAGLRPDEEFSI